MKAVVFTKKSATQRFVYTDVEKPVPNDNEVLIKIIAVSVNAADYRSLQMGIIPKKRIFGADVAGIVEVIGKNIKELRVGDEVFGDILGGGSGGFAEYAVAPERLLVKKPANISFEDTSTIPIAGLTALQALRDKGKIQKGMSVLVAGSGGGVGTFAVQLAKYYKTEVTAICSTRNVDQSRELGATHVIDYTKEDFRKGGKRYDLIVAINGNYPPWTYTRLLNKNGICAVIGGGLPQIFGAMIIGPFLSLRSKKITVVSAKAVPADLSFLAELMAEGKIRSVIEKIYPLEQAGEAMEYAGKGHVRGKIVVKVGLY